MRNRIGFGTWRTAIVAAAAGTASSAGVAQRAWGEYTVQRLVTGLNQPVFVTTAPGDNTDLFIVNRRSADSSAGDIVVYNRLTRQTTTFLDLSGTVPPGAGGAIGLAFHPDFQTNGLFYVDSFVNSNNARLEEYKVIGGVPTLQRTLLQYTNLTDVHSIDWIGFQPGATGAARNYLYVTTGDGGIQADDPSFLDRGQDPTVLNGKVLRLDVDPQSPDAYPSDPNKNFAIPGTNPFVSDQTGKLKEIFETGFRNPWRASFDRGTGDLYVADVGFNTKEEVDFTQNGASFNSGSDFGWAKREGTIATPQNGVGGPQGTSINPIYQVDHPTFTSITGGYVYRGPIAELRGKYLFADWLSGDIRSLNFDRNTDPATFDGSTSGISNVVDMTATLNSKIGGSAGPMYLVVSFGEDNAGNLYVVGFSHSGAGGSPYNPALGTGEIYEIAPLPADANTDGFVDVRDLYALATHWQQPGDFTQGDFNFDGFVDASDLSILAQHWQGNDGLAALEQMSSALGITLTNVPEPTLAFVIPILTLICGRRTARAASANHRTLRSA